jgi:hypothetical protein
VLPQAKKTPSEIFFQEKKSIRGACLNKLAHSWTAEPPFVQARASSGSLFQSGAAHLVAQNSTRFLLDLFLQRKGIQPGQELFQARDPRRLDLRTDFEPLKGRSCFVIDVPFAAAFDLGAVLHHRAKEIAKKAPLFALERIE